MFVSFLEREKRVRPSLPEDASPSEKTGRVRRGTREEWEAREYSTPRAA